MSDAPIVDPAATVPTVDVAPRPKRKTNKCTYILHGPDNEVMAHYRSTSHRNAALKAASKKVTVIRIRRSGDKTVRIFEGTLLDAPRTVKRGDKEICYKFQPRVRYLEAVPFVPRKPTPKAEPTTPEPVVDSGETVQ